MLSEMVNTNLLFLSYIYMCSFYCSRGDLMLYRNKLSVMHITQLKSTVFMVCTGLASELYYTCHIISKAEQFEEDALSQLQAVELQ